jgi:spore coat protein U-like protein
MAMRKFSTISALLAASALLAMNGVAHADDPLTASGTLSVNATVTDECLIGPATLSFGSFQSFAAAGTAAAPGHHTADANVAVPVACTDGTAGKIYMAASSVTLSGTGTNTETLSAALSAASSGGTAYPTTGATGVSYTGTGASTNVTVYGEVVTKTTTVPDVYSGSTTMKIDY